MLHLPIYLDYNATTPVDERVAARMFPYFTQKFGNAASHNHPFGWQAAEAVDQAREETAALLGAEPGEIIFTSGATESDNLAIKGVLEMYAVKGNHIITCVTEHKAVLDTCAYGEKTGAEVTYLPVDRNGLIDLDQLEAAIRPTTVLIAIMYANNETGVIQPVKAISAIARQYGILFFTDATQAVGKIPVDVDADGIDMLALSAHKIYGPKGIGALYMRRKNPRVRLSPQIHGGGHQKGLRSGTLNVPAIVGLGKACQLCREEMATDASRLQLLRDKLEQSLLELGDCHINGIDAPRLPQITNISFSHIEGDALLMGIQKEIAVSSGSACTSASPEPSYVLRAMGLDHTTAHSSLRFSLGRFSTAEEIDYTIQQVRATVLQVRDMSPLWEQHLEATTKNK